MIDYKLINYDKRTYVSGSIVKGVRRVRHYATAGRDTSDCVSLFDFVMSHYAYDVTRLREGRRWKLIDGDVMVFDDEAAWYM